ncbi:MBL fold metallo-hydrolase [Chryseobacterium sp. RG1]|uniref:MBL fold metallo-hydrolase n=1 Tax=Chryseobacterium tagetis TaxID=2801334 RepID=A0ABS7ZZ04_9FLAO|nr:MBL fold metallo-hydrolase [Chryseobacterium tagetis]MCA6066407.1 MBL fold metallo-hydrolase [Chryseobacterium tagetis]
MNRRNAIKLATIASSLLLTPSTMGQTIIDKSKVKNKALIAPLVVHLGKIDFLLFSDGQMTFDKAQPTFAPMVSKIDFEAGAEKLHLQKNIIDLGINIMLIQKSDKTILIDAGMGKHFGDNQGKLLENLIHAGIDPRSITNILITHGHRDHIGGIISLDRTQNFPNAKYHIAKKEYDFWMSDIPDFSHSKLSAEQIKATVSFTKNILEKIDSKLEKFEPGEKLFGFIQTELAVGHTPGQTIFTITSEEKSVKNIVDVFHTPLMVAQPDWGVCLDVDFNQGIKTRIRLLEESFANKTLLMSSHLPWPGLGYIDKENDQYNWNAFKYYTPTNIQL